MKGSAKERGAGALIAEIASLRRETVGGWTYVDAAELDSVMAERRFDLHKALAVLQGKGPAEALVMATVLADADDDSKRPFETYVRMARKALDALKGFAEAPGSVETYGIFEGALVWEHPEGRADPLETHAISMRGHGVSYAAREFKRRNAGGERPGAILDAMRTAPGWTIEQTLLIDEDAARKVEDEGWKARLREA